MTSVSSRFRLRSQHALTYAGRRAENGVDDGVSWSLISGGSRRRSLSHRWLDPILLGRHPAGGESAIVLLERDDENRAAGFQQAHVSRAVTENRRIGSDNEFR